MQQDTKPNDGIVTGHVAFMWAGRMVTRAGMTERERRWLKAAAELEDRLARGEGEPPADPEFPPALAAVGAFAVVCAVLWLAGP